MLKNTGVDGILGKLKDGMDQVMTGAQDKIHEAQLRAQYRTIEREKTEQLTALGTALYAMHQSADIQLETLTSQFAALGSTDSRLQEKQREIDEFVAASAANAATAASPQQAPSAADRHCECGAILSPAAHFCPACGRPNPVEPVYTPEQNPP